MGESFCTVFFTGTMEVEEKPHLSIWKERVAAIHTVVTVKKGIEALESTSPVYHWRSADHFTCGASSAASIPLNRCEEKMG